MTPTRDGAGKTALVTGASAGIGMAFARVLAQRGFNLVITARRAERLANLARELESLTGVSVRAVPADLARADAARQLVVANQRHGSIINERTHEGLATSGMRAASQG